MALKPIPRLILIVAAIGGIGYGASIYLTKNPQVINQANPQSAPVNTPVAAVTTLTPAAQNTQPTVGAGGAYQTIVEKGVVRVSVQSPSKPFFFNDRGTAKGFNVEFLKMLFAQPEFTRIHSQIVIDTDHAVDTYPKVPEALLKKDTRGNFVTDIAIDGLTFTDGDLNGVVYSVPYVSDFGYSLITSARMQVRSLTDLNGMSVGVLQGDPDVEAYVKSHMPGVKVIALSDASVNGERTWINDAIKSGKVDAIVYDYPFAVAEVSGTDLQFAITKLPESDIKYKIGVRKEDTQLLENINVAIRKVKETEDYSNMLKRYFMSKNVASVRTASNDEKVYVVKQGDTLSTIAGITLGNKMRYSEIESRNNLANPNFIQVGQRLVIPK